MALSLWLAWPVGAAPVGDAWQRPALMVRQPERSVLLAAAWAGDRIVAVGERGIVVVSDDAGGRWRQSPSPVSVTLTMVRFADAKNGVAVGHGGTVLITTDAGATWQRRLDGRRIAQLAKDAANTAEARRDAERLEADGPDKPLLDVLVWDAQRMLVVGAYGIALQTSDAGATWTPWMGRLPNPKGLHWYVARRAGDVLLLAGEQGLLARSDDGGATFKPLASPYKGSWFTGEIDVDGRLLIAGLRGNVWRSGDGGTSWTAMPSPVPATITAAARAADGSTLLASQAGIVMKLQHDAIASLNSTPVPMPAALLARRDGSVLTLGVGGAVSLPVAGGRP